MKKLLVILLAAGTFGLVANASDAHINRQDMSFLPDYCFGVNVENSEDEIILEKKSNRVYNANYGTTMLVSIASMRAGGFSMQGVVEGVVFAGGGSQSFKANLSLTRSGINGFLYVITDSWTYNSTDTYKIICD